MPANSAEYQRAYRARKKAERKTALSAAAVQQIEAIHDRGVKDGGNPKAFAAWRDSAVKVFRDEPVIQRMTQTERDAILRKVNRS